jgi:tetratricopeptide (TPR) repeat protein
MGGRLFRIVIFAGALGIYYWGLFVSPAVTRAPPQAPEDGRVTAARIDMLMAAERYAEALEPLMILHRQHPKNLVYVEQLSRVQRKLGRREEEARTLEVFIRLSPKPADACPRIGLVYKELKLTAQAIDAFERCIGFDPDDPSLRFHLGLLYERSRRTDTAFQLYQQGAAISPTNPDLATGLARLHFRAGRSAEARRLVQIALERRPKDPDALLVAGLVERNLRNHPLARTYLEQGLSGRNSAELWLALGTVAEAEGKRDEALGHYTRAQELDPASEDARKRRQRLLASLTGARR